MLVDGKASNRHKLTANIAQVTSHLTWHTYENNLKSQTPAAGHTCAVLVHTLVHTQRAGLLLRGVSSIRATSLCARLVIWEGYWRRFNAGGVQEREQWLSRLFWQT